MKNLFLLLVFTVILVSCDSLKIELEGDAEKVKKWSNMAVLELISTPPESPVFPLIDAGIYNGNFNDIYGDIIIFHEQVADSIVDYLGEKLEEYSKSKVLYGTKLFDILTLKEIEKQAIKIYPPILDNDDFPKITLPTYAKNFFYFSLESTPYGYFENNSKYYQSNIQKICQYLQVDGLIVGTVSVHTVGVGLFGSTGDRKLFINLFFIDKEGKITLKGIVETKNLSGKPGSIENYKLKFNSYYNMTDKLLRKLYLNEEPADEPKSKKKKINR